MIDVFMPRSRDDVLDTKDDEIDVTEQTDYSRLEFKRFCCMNKLLENRPKITEGEAVRACFEEKLAIDLLLYFVI